MSVIVFCDAAARGFASAALKVPVKNMALYTLVDMVVSYGFFLKLHSKIEQTLNRKSVIILYLALAAVVARIAGCFAGFAAAEACNCPVRLADAVWMSCASAVVLLPVLRKFA
ncbi:MAG: hypothetical protein JSS10_01005 [Verrucomicrobia bacterium]|nr:hypothetical protein [Verrucomicrobiota bacterium]